MSDIENISEELFFKLRNRFPKINMGDENGQVTTSPLEARFFNFKFNKEGRNYGVVTCSLIDNASLKIYFSQDIAENMDDEVAREWFSFLRELRKFAKSNMLTFDVRDIEKDSLSQKDIEFTSRYHKEKTAVQESKINWERHGRFSEGNHKSIKIHVVHNNKLSENPNNRLLGIEKMYLVNENKERFLLPFISISGAKAMATHCSHGGTPYDADGVTITKAVSEMKNLSRFGMALRNKTFESEEPVKVMRAARHIKEQIRKNLNRMAGARNFEEGMEGLRGLLANESTDKTEVLKDWFIQKTYDDKLDTWLESATNAIRRCMEQNVDLNEEDNVDYSDAILDKDQTAKRAANPAQVGTTLPLYANDSKDKEMRDLIKTQPMRGMIRLILADISTRAVDDETAILASKADEGEFTAKHKKMIEAYLKDLFSSNPPREVPGPKKDLYGKKKTAEEEFEEEIMGMGEPAPEEDTEESIGDKHKRERFKSLKKIKGRLRSEEEEEEMEESNGAECNHTMEGEHCPVHGMNECGAYMNEGISDLRRLAGLGECGDMMGGDDMTGGWMVMGQPHDTAAVQRDSAEMDRAKRLEQAIADKANADAEAQTNWIISQIRSQPVWTPPNFEHDEEEEDESIAAPADHPHADQAHPQYKEQPEEETEEESEEEVEEEEEETDEGNAFTGALAKTEKGGEFKVGEKSYTDTSSHDAEEEEEEVEEEETEEKAMSEEFKRMLRLAGLEENAMVMPVKDEEEEDLEDSIEADEEGLTAEDAIGSLEEMPSLRPVGRQAGRRAAASDKLAYDRKMHGRHAPTPGEPGQSSKAAHSAELQDLMAKYLGQGGQIRRVKEAAKPDFLDADKDGNKKEPMKKALADKEKTDEALEILKKAAGIW